MPDHPRSRSRRRPGLLAAAVLGVALTVLSPLVAAPAWADDKLRDLCAERPGLDTPACTVDPGHLQVEVGLGDWMLDKQPDGRTDTIVAGDISARYGVGESTEVRLGWTAYGHSRTRDYAIGAVERLSGTGDITIGLKQNLSSPSGDGFSIALLSYATLPIGKNGLGFLISQGQNNDSVSTIFVGIISIGLLGLLIDTIVQRSEAAVLPWRRHLVRTDEQ